MFLIAAPQNLQLHLTHLHCCVTSTKEARFSLMAGVAYQILSLS
jgi:hypothetical protein